MKASRIIRTAVSAVLSAAVVSTAALVPSVSTASAASAGKSSTYNSYFNDVYPKLTDSAPVFEAITLSKLHYLLQQDGNFIILWGGKTSAALQNDVSVINAEAKAYGVTTVYNFDPQLDGGADGDVANIEGTSASTLNYAKQQYAQIFSELYPSADPGFSASVSYTDPAAGAKTVEAIPVPTLFIYNKSHKDASGSIAPVIGSVSDTSAAGLDAQSLKSKVDALLGSISSTVNGKTLANFAAYSDTSFFTDAFNHQGAINGDFTNTDSKAIFGSDDAPLVFKSVTYDELTELLKSKGNYVLFFGGSWCPNTRAAVKWINQEAKKYGIDTVYNFDTHLDDNFHSNSDPLNIRTSTAYTTVTINNGAAVNDATDKNNSYGASKDTVASPISNLYVNLVNTYLPNLLTEYGADSDVSYTDASGKTVGASKLQVPFVLTYDKDNTNARGAAPVLRENVIPAAGSDYPNGVQELMYSWATVQPTAAPETGNTLNDYTIETNTLDALFQSLDVHLLAKQYASVSAEKSKYTDASFKAYSTALDEALSVSADYAKSAADILAAYNKFEAAAKALVAVSAGTNASSAGSSSKADAVSSTSSSDGNPNTGDAGLPAAVVVLFALGAAGAWGAAHTNKHSD